MTINGNDLMRNATVYSTCQVCYQPLQMVSADDRTHPMCAGDVDPPGDGLRLGLLSTILAGDSESQRLTAAQLAKDNQRSLSKSAMFYAKQFRWPVFPLRAVGGKCDGDEKCEPLCQCPKKPATKNGFKDATADPGRVTTYWERRPTSNIGLATGVAFDVLDVDVPEGIASFTELIEQKRLPDIHGVAVTASGGLHLYVTPTGTGNRAGFMPGLDYRGVGGYVVAPPSTLTTGWVATSCDMWQWIIPPSPRIKGK